MITPSVGRRYDSSVKYEASHLLGLKKNLAQASNDKDRNYKSKAIFLLITSAIVLGLAIVAMKGSLSSSGGYLDADSRYDMRDADTTYTSIVTPILSQGHSTSTGGMSKSEALDAAQQTGGIDINIEVDSDKDETITWSGENGGQIKPRGSLLGKKVGVILASEFSDFQVYYLASYIGENAGECEFLLVDWVTWKNTRPNVPDKSVRGMWDLSVDPMTMMGGSNKASYKRLRAAHPLDYDVLVVVGGHSSDVMVTEPEVVDFIKVAAKNRVVLGSIGEGSMLFIAAGILDGKKVTGNRLVDYMLRRIAHLEDAPVVSDTDGDLYLITARDTVDTPAFLRSLCRAFDSSYKDIWKDSLKGKTVLFPVGEDFEDIELVVPVLELLYRGADVVIGRFEPQFKSRPPHESSFALGNFGITVPFQEIPKEYYSIVNLDDVKMHDFDVVVIIGAFNPWNMVATGRTEWLKKAHSAGKKIAAICHGPIPVAKADLVAGRKVTGWLASKDSVEIMGGEFKPSEWAAVVDGPLISGRTPPEIPEFIDAISVALLN